jgi:hypothetical protein
MVDGLLELPTGTAGSDVGAVFAATEELEGGAVVGDSVELLVCVGFQ